MIPKKSLAVAAAALFAAMSLVSQAAHAGPRLDKIMETKVIRVGTPGDYRPFAIKTDAGYSGHDIDVIETMAKEEFLMLPHPVVRDYMQRKVSNIDRWLEGMNRWRAKKGPAQR